MKYISVCLALLAVNVANFALAHDHKKTDEVHFGITKLDAGVLMLSGQGGFTGGNIVISTGPDGVIMIDNGVANFESLLQQTIEKAIGKPVDYVVNTHLHGDHTGNNGVFAKQGARIIAHKNVRAKMALKDGDGSPNVPVFTFTDEFSSYLNGQPLSVVHVHHAHTDGDSFVYFSDINVIHTGDLFFNGLYPFIDLDNGGSVEGYIKAQSAILTLINDNTKVVPGHGPLATKADLQATQRMLIKAKNKVQALIDEGQTLAQVLKANPLDAFHDQWSWSFITTEKMTKTLYRSLTAKLDTLERHHSYK